MGRTTHPRARTLLFALVAAALLAEPMQALERPGLDLAARGAGTSPGQAVPEPRSSEATGAIPTGPGNERPSDCTPVGDRILVRFDERAAGNDHGKAYARAGVRVRTVFRGIRGLEIVRAKGDVRKAVTELASDADVLYAEPDCRVSIDLLPNDTSFSQQWALRNTGQTGGTSGSDIDAPGAWDVRTSASSIVVAVIDTGIQANHPDLASNVWVNTDEIAANGLDDDANGYVDDRQGYDFFNGDHSPADDNGHGTHVSGTIGAVGNNGIGVTGVAWSVKIMPLKAFNSAGQGSTSSIVEALGYAIDNGAMVANHSYSTTEYSRAMYDTFVAARAAGIFSAAAAGNESVNSDEQPRYPSSFRLDSMLSVAATTDTDALASFSNYGIYNVHVAAPGESILSTVPGSAYASFNGTSMATPHVVGVAALLAAAHPTWTAQQIRARIVGTTRAVPGLVGKTWTGGVLDAGAALGAGVSVPPAAYPPFTVDPLSTTAIAAPNPPPADPPAPPTFPVSTELESSQVDHEPPSIALDATGQPAISYTDRYDGVFLWSKATGTWAKRRLSASYDDFYWQDLAFDGAGEPVVALQRSWTDLEAYGDPGIVTLRGTSPTPTEARITASCPAPESCFYDWIPAVDYDTAENGHVVFARYPAESVQFGDFLRPPAGSGTASGAGIYYGADGGTGTWTLRRLTTNATDDVPVVAGEADGTAHVVFTRRAGSGSGLYYATNDGGSWSIRRLTDHVQDDRAAVAIDATGALHVAFTRRGQGVFYLRRATDGSWSTEVQIQNSDVYMIDLAIDGANKVHVVVGLVNGFNTTSGVRYLTNKTGSWIGTTIENHEAAFPQIAVNAAGQAFIAYNRYSGPPLGLYYATNVTGTFQTTLVEARSKEGTGYGAEAAYAVDAAGYGHVALGSHYGTSNPGVWYGTNRTGSWQFSRVDSGFPSSLALALDANGKVHIAFASVLDATGDGILPLAQWRIGYATNASGGWASESVITGNTVSADGIAIDLDSAGRPQVVFPNYAGDHLFRARRIAGWQIDDAYSGGTGIRHPSIVLDHFFLA